MRECFDGIEIYDLRGDGRASRPAGITEDGPVFNILAGTAITLAWARGASKLAGTLANVTYHDAWAAGAFSRAAKLAWLTNGTTAGRLPGGVTARIGALDDMKPAPITFPNWIGLDECFLFRSSGMETKRDEVVYDFLRESLIKKLDRYVSAPFSTVQEAFNSTDLKPFVSARAFGRLDAFIRQAAYRPFDTRHHYRHPAWNDRLRPEFQSVWGDSNLCLFALPTRTGDGPAVWCHALFPDRHAFRGSTGGYAFPLFDQRPMSHLINLTPSLLGRLATAHHALSTPQKVFDAILCLLSARSYTLRFATDLEGDFPHVPFPRNAGVMSNAADLGAHIRNLQTFATLPDPHYDTAKVTTAPGASTELASNIAYDAGTIILGSDGSARLEGVPRAVWDFAVSGYALLPHWLTHRKRQKVDAALLAAIRDLISRTGHLIALMAEADIILSSALTDPLTRNDFGL